MSVRFSEHIGPADAATTAFPVRILLADGHPIVRYGLKNLFQVEDDLEVVGEAGDGREVINKVQELDPDVLLLDLRMPNLDGLSVLPVLKQNNKRTRVIVLTASEDENELVHAMKLGCSGIVLKHTAPELIVKSIRTVHAGGVWLDSHAPAVLLGPVSTSLESAGGARGGKGRERSPLLSAREREIVAWVAQGYKNKEMAVKMLISEQTVKNHLHTIFDKLGVSDRLELAFYTIHQGLHLTGEGMRLPRRPQSGGRSRAPSRRARVP